MVRRTFAFVERSQRLRGSIDEGLSVRKAGVFRGGVLVRGSDDRVPLFAIRAFRERLQ